mgnify:CR=1 FL=1
MAPVRAEDFISSVHHTVRKERPILRARNPPRTGLKFLVLIMICTW